MIPIDKVKNIIERHILLEKELSSGKIQPKFLAKKSKEYSDLKNIIPIAKEYIDFEKNKVSKEINLNVLSGDNNIRNDNDTKTTENKETKLDELIQEFEGIKRKLLSKEQFDYTKERNVFNDIINKLSGFFKLRDYGDNNSPRSLITKAEISALNGDLKSVLYYLEKLPDDWKVGLKNFISKCKLFLEKKNG